MCVFILNFIAAEYIIQCRRSDPKLIDCLKGSLHHLRPYLAQGIPAIEVCRSIIFNRNIFIIFVSCFCTHRALYAHFFMCYLN